MLFNLFRTFFAIGAFTFGGGTAMISMMEKSIVRKREWLDIEEFLDIISLAQAAPGAMAVNSSILVGYRIGGLGGATISCLGTVLPSFIIMLIVAGFLVSFRDYELVDKMFNGIRPVVAGLMASSVISLGTASKLKTSQYIGVGLVALLVSYFHISPVIIILVGGCSYLAYKFITRERSK